MRSTTTLFPRTDPRSPSQRGIKVTDYQSRRPLLPRRSHSSRPTYPSILSQTKVPTVMETTTVKPTRKTRTPTLPRSTLSRPHLDLSPTAEPGNSSTRRRRVPRPVPITSSTMFLEKVDVWLFDSR
jgi:hypothetical protein